MKRICAISVVLAACHAFQCLSQAVGPVIWEFQTGGPVWAVPAIDSEGTIYIGAAETNQFYAINPDGTQKWKVRVRNPTQAVVGPGNRIFVGEAGVPDGKFFAFDAEGKRLWDFEANDPAVAVGADGRIYISSSRRLFALAPDGGVLWTYTNTFRVVCLDSVLGPPIIGHDQAVYVTAGGADRRVLAFNPNGTMRWQFNTGREAYEDGGECGTIILGEVWGLPAMGADGTIYVGAKLATSYFSTSRPILYAINASGTTNWHLSLNGGVIESPAIGADGTIYVTTLAPPTNRLEAISSTGIWRWDAQIPGFSARSPALAADGTILMGSTTEFVTTAMNSTNQNVLALPGDLWAPVIAPGGRVYVSSYQGTLYALRGTADAAKTPWPMHRRDVTQSGRAPSIATNRPALVSVRQRGGSLLEVRYTGEVARDYQIEASSNLLDWEAISGFASVELVVPFRDPGASGSRSRFYRLRSP